MSILQSTGGTELPPIVKSPITQAQLRYYADASGDHNPIHVDEEAARRVGLDNVIAHGMLSMAYLGQFVSQHISAIPDAFIKQLKVRFVNMVKVGDVLTCHGIVMVHHQIDDDMGAVAIECWAQNQHGEKVTVGEAIVAVPLKVMRM